MAHVRQSRPDSGLGFQVKVFELFYGVPSSLGSGQAEAGCSRVAVDAEAESAASRAKTSGLILGFWLRNCTRAKNSGAEQGGSKHRSLKRRDGANEQTPHA